MSMLPTYVLAWRTSAEALLGMAPHLTDAEWATPTDCPGWTVQDIYAHSAHLEAELCAAKETPAEIDNRQQMPQEHTEAGVDARRGRPADEVVAELAARVEERGARLDPLPEDPDAPAPMTSAGLRWSWDTLLRNRSIDMWMHEQDVRRAAGKPGGLDSPGAMVTINSLAFTLPYVLGKKVGAPAGTIVRWNVTGEVPLNVKLVVGGDGRAHRTDEPVEPSVTLAMSSETFAILMAGRQAPHEVEVTVSGDDRLGQQVLAAMTVTP